MPNNIRGFLLSISSSFILVSGAWSSTLDLSKAILASTLNASTHLTRDTRDHQADLMREYWKHFQSRVPNLSPSELQWLEEELNASGERFDRAIRSREFGLHHTQRIANDCALAVNDLVESRASYEAAPQLETFLWIKVAACYSRSDSIRMNLQQAGLSDGRWDGPFYLAHNDMILEHILDATLPSALADGEGWRLELVD